jgi:hypothetical protein
MSDRNPKVRIEPTGDGLWVAKCKEPGCTWTQGPDLHSYASERAKAHRRSHREAADRG